MKIYWKKVFYFVFLLGSMFGFKNAVGQNDSIQNNNIESNLSENLFQISGVVKSSNDSTPIPFCNIALFDNSDRQISITQTDFDGNFILNSISCEKFYIKVFLHGYKSQIIRKFSENNTIFINIAYDTIISCYMPARQVNYDNLFFDYRNTKSSETYNSKEIQRMPGRKPIIIR